MADIKSWQTMIKSNAELLKRKTGDDAAAWTARARAAGIDSVPGLRTWLCERSVSGYSAMAVEWDMFGYPDFMLKDADELIDGQYADRPQLRPIADALMVWAMESGAEIQARRTYVSLQTPRRKFAQITPTNKTSVDLILRIATPAAGRLEAVKAPVGDPFDRRVRLKSLDEVDREVLDLLDTAQDQSLQRQPRR